MKIKNTLIGLAVLAGLTLSANAEVYKAPLNVSPFVSPQDSKVIKAKYAQAGFGKDFVDYVISKGQIIYVNNGSGVIGVGSNPEVLKNITDPQSNVYYAPGGRRVDEIIENWLQQEGWTLAPWPGQTMYVNDSTTVFKGSAVSSSKKENVIFQLLESLDGKPYVFVFNMKNKVGVLKDNDFAAPKPIFN